MSAIAKAKRWKYQAKYRNVRRRIKRLANKQQRQMVKNAIRNEKW